jgi:hypothetical protein
VLGSRDIDGQTREGERAGAKESVGRAIRQPPDREITVERGGSCRDTNDAI